MKRHPQLSIRKPEHTSAARIEAFTQKNISDFYDKYEQVIKKYNILPEDIYNVDETPVSCVLKGTANVIAANGKKQVGSRVSGERGEHVTAEVCFSATGKYVPSLNIFPRKNSKPEYLRGAPEGAMIEFHPSGYMQSDIFTKWMQNFIDFAKPTKEKKVLLILDGHSTHVRNLEAIELARKNNVIMLCLPPHCNHKLQPVDVSFNKPLSTYFASEHNVWMRTNKKMVNF